jgi:hypothetical protein
MMTPKLTFAIAILLIAGCGTSLTPGLPADAYQAEADAVVVMAFAAVPGDAAPSPDDAKPDRKVGDKCDNCNGSGRSGDGLGRCNVCKGDGRIDRDDIGARGLGPRLLDSVTTTTPIVPTATTSPTAETSPVTIELHVSQQTAGGWARAWWYADKPYFETLGCKVTFVKETDATETWIQVCGATTCKRIDGQPTRDQLKAIVETTK